MKRQKRVTGGKLAIVFAVIVGTALSLSSCLDLAEGILDASAGQQSSARAANSGGTLNIWITNRFTGASVSGALVEISGPGYQSTRVTNAYGRTFFSEMPPGVYSVTVMAGGLGRSNSETLYLRGPVTMRLPV